MAAPVQPQAPQPNGIISLDGDDGHHGPQGDNTAQASQAPAEPQLYDVDLETMHVDLYKGKFLTPTMFLEEVGKMVYNAEVRAHQDRDRLYKAQAMYTAAEVSIQEFDPAFRLECERMAGRESKRREQRREQRRKSRAGSREGSVNGHGSGGDNPVRRSARNNGQAPELGITDPLLLERRLKRHRSQDVNGDVHASGEDSGADRDSKRSKLDAILEESDHDELDLVGPNSSQPRPASVRFAPISDSAPQTPSKANLPNGHLPLETIPEVNSEPRPSGFDPHLLNPIYPPEPPLPSVQSLIVSDLSSNFMHATSSNFVPEQPTFLQTPDMPAEDFQMHPPNVPDNLYLTPGPSNPLFAPVPNIDITVPQEPRRSVSPAPVMEQSQASPVPPEQQEFSPEISMEVEIPRTPSPPPPPFNVSESLLLGLENKFVEKTDKLTVEQLEQLRATSLNVIWRHRQEWDRDACLRELERTVEEFAEEAKEEEGDVDEDSF